MDLAWIEMGFFVKQDDGLSEKTSYFLDERKVSNYHASLK